MNPVEVAAVAGHSDPSITLRLYGHRVDDGSTAAEFMGAIIRNTAVERPI